MSSRSQKSKGFTVIELAITIGIVLVCLLLVLPAIQRSRQLARVNSCENNLKQLGLAMHNYHDTHHIFPPGWITHASYGNSKSGYGWHTMILPFVEQASFYDRMEFEVPYSKGAFGKTELNGKKIEQTIIPLFRCPNDTTSELNLMRGGWATSNYSGNYGSNPAPRLVGNGGAKFWPGGTVITPLRTNGIMWWNGGAHIRYITDGTSNTFMLGERSVNSAAGIWAGVRSNNIESDQVTDGSYGNEINSGSNSYSSLHLGGAFFMIADGSVRFISEDIDSRPESKELPGGGIFQRLSNRADRQRVDHSSF